MITAITFNITGVAHELIELGYDTDDIEQLF